MFTNYISINTETLTSFKRRKGSRFDLRSIKRDGANVARNTICQTRQLPVGDTITLKNEGAGH